MFFSAWLPNTDVGWIHATEMMVKGTRDYIIFYGRTNYSSTPSNLYPLVSQGYTVFTSTATEKQL